MMLMGTWTYTVLMKVQCDTPDWVLVMAAGSGKGSPFLFIAQRLSTRSLLVFLPKEMELHTDVFGCPPQGSLQQLPTPSESNPYSLNCWQPGCWAGHSTAELHKPSKIKSNRFYFRQHSWLKVNKVWPKLFLYSFRRCKQMLNNRTFRAAGYVWA